MKKGSGKDRGVSGEDFLLWKEFTRDIEPLDGRAAIEAPPPERDKSVWSGGGEKPSTPIPYTHTPKQPSTMDATPQLDARTESRLRRGQMPVEARLDLHGLNQEEAHHRLNDFVVRAQKQGKRCVLVITGKGSRGEGILRQKLPLWLSIGPLRGLVLKTYPAVPRDGGAGAWYIYLKRDRNGL